MRRVMYYFVIISQVVILLTLTIQYERIDHHGQVVKLLTAAPIPHAYYDEALTGDVYVDFEINQISDENWQIDSSISTNDRVYVLLRSDANGIYHVVEATTEKNTAQNDHELVLLGTYSYSDDNTKTHYINYGMEKIKNIDQYGNFKHNKSMIITLLISERWGQKKIIDIQISEAK